MTSCICYVRTNIAFRAATAHTSPQLFTVHLLVIVQYFSIGVPYSGIVFLGALKVNFYIVVWNKYPPSTTFAFILPVTHHSLKIYFFCH